MTRCGTRGNEGGTLLQKRERQDVTRLDTGGRSFVNGMFILKSKHLTCFSFLLSSGTLRSLCANDARVVSLMLLTPFGVVLYKGKWLLRVFVDDSRKLSVAKPQEFDGYRARIKQEQGKTRACGEEPKTSKV